MLAPRLPRGRTPGRPGGRPTGLASRKLLVAATAAVATLATACGGDSGSGGGSSSDSQTITIAYAAPVPDHMIPSVTEAAGFFKKHGVNVKIEFLQQSQLIPALVSGKVQFASLASPGYQVASLNGQIIQSIAEWEDSFNVVWVTGPANATPQSMDGKSVAISSPGAFSDLCAKIVEQKYSIKLKELPLGNNANAVAAYQSGSADSVATLSPNQLPGAEKALPGTHVLQDFREIRGVPGLELVGFQPWMQKNRATTVNVVKAINEGIAYFKSNKTEAVATIAKELKQTPEVAGAGYDDTIKAMSSSTVPSVEAHKTVLKYLVAAYPKAATFDASKLVDTSYQKEAGGQ